MNDSVLPPPRPPEPGGPLRRDEVVRIADDLKSPLQVIGLELELLRWRTANIGAVPVRYTIERIQRSVTSLDRLVGELLERLREPT